MNDPSHVHVLAKDHSEGILSISQNLDLALRHLRHRSISRLMWIDALCINQADSDEKSIQVTLMGLIYSQADSVIAWLGPEEHDSQIALILMQHWAKHVEADWDFNQLTPAAQSNDHTWADVHVPIPFQPGELDAVCALVNRPYFQRTWVRQEVVLGSKAYFQCGIEKLPWLDFRKAIACLSWKKHDSAAYRPVRDINVRISAAVSLCQMSLDTFYYSNIRILMRDTKCEDPRDRIYAILTLLNPEDRKLDVKPDYSRTVEDLYTDVARRNIVERCQLNVFETCELSSRSIDIPSWVPDWSTHLNFHHITLSRWSACAWISAQATVIDDKTIRVTGMNMAQIQNITEYEFNISDWTYDDLLEILRKVRPTADSVNNQDTSALSSLEKYCRCFAGDSFSNDFVPPRAEKPRFEDGMRDLNIIWSSNARWNDLTGLTSNFATHYATRCASLLHGRCLFTATDGHFGLAPANTQKGDMVCVLLGCRFPVVLRPSSASQLPTTWQVVGICQAQGLMNGEAIYRDKLPSHYRPVVLTESSHPDRWIDEMSFAFRDTETNNCNTDPAHVLAEMGIKVDIYRRQPHLLQVSPTSLIAAGVKLQDFTLT
jgi:hypothetical protein